MTFRKPLQICKLLYDCYYDYALGISLIRIRLET